MRNIFIIAEPLWRPTKTGAVWKWEDEECAAFEAVLTVDALSFLEQFCNNLTRKIQTRNWLNIASHECLQR